MENQNVWPISKFRFSVDIGDQKDIAFQEVLGLATEAQVIESREQDSEFSPIKMPGMFSSGSVILKNGVFVKDNKFGDWYNQIKIKTIERETVIIKLLNEKRDSEMKWTLEHAYPTKISDVDLKPEGGEVVIESLEIAHEGIEITNG